MVEEPTPPAEGGRSGKAVHGNRYRTGRAVAVALDGGRVAAWTDGLFTGDPLIIRDAQIAAEFGWEVRVTRVPIHAGKDSPLGAVAALCAHDPGRTIVAYCPPEVSHTLTAWHETHHPDSREDPA